MSRRVVSLLSVGLLAATAALLFFLGSRRDADDGGVPSAEDSVDAAGPRAAAPGAVGPRRTDGAPPPGEPTRGLAPDGSPGATPRWVVSGTVVAAGAGTPLAGATLAIEADRHPETLGGTEGFRPPGLASMVTDGAGNFRVALDAGAPATMSVRHPDARPAVVSLDGSSLGLRIELDAGFRVAGRVVTRGGKALEGATVTPTGGASDAAGGRLETLASTTSDRDGRFSVRVDPKAPGSLSVAHATHVTRRVSLDLAVAGERLVELTPALVAWFRPRPSDRSHLDRAAVWWTSGARSGQETLVGSVRPPRGDPPWPDVAGCVELPLDPAGTPISVRIVVPGFLPWTEELTSVQPEGEVRAVDVALERDPAAGGVAVSLERPDGSPMTCPEDAGVVVERADGGPAPASNRTIDGSGTLVVEGLPAGAYRFRVWLGGLGPAEGEATVVAGTTVGARARATDEARLRVRVTGTGGRRALVRILSAGKGAQPRVVDDPSGKARVEHVAVSGVPSVVVVVGEEGVTFGGLPGGTHRVEVVSPDVAATPVEVELKPGETAAAEVVGTIR